MQIAIETRHACIDVGMRVIEHIICELADAFTWERYKPNSSVFPPNARQQHCLEDTYALEATLICSALRGSDARAGHPMVIKQTEGT
ncbi:hypothetical protein [Pseudomonas sp. 31 R 17]|nr:hypothetical protein [Pseudomonas sp. 31 R 17]